MSDFPARNATALGVSKRPTGVWTMFFGVLGLGWSGSAHAAAPPEGAGTGVEAASSGSDAIGGEGSFATVAEEPDDAAEGLDSTDLTLSAGGMFSTGNATSLAITGRADFRLRRQIHQFSATLLGNYGAAILKNEPALVMTETGLQEAPEDEDAELETVVGNVQGQVRYDVFFHERWSAFLMLTGRRDTFQGFDIRTNVDPGIAFYALTDANHRLWFELGYDYRFEYQTEDFVTAREGESAHGKDPERVLHDHAGRLFVGYANQLHETLSFTTGLEYTQSFLSAEAHRINFDAGINAQVAKRLSFAVTFQLRYNGEVPSEDKQLEKIKKLPPRTPDDPPLEIFKRLDTITAFNVVYKL